MHNKLEPKKKSICHISSVHFALDTRIYYKMCRSLSNTYNVTLIAIHHSKEQIGEVKIIPFYRYKSRKWRIAIGWLHMFIKCLRANASLYHMHDPELIPCGLLLRLIGKKVIWDIHENIAEDLFDKPWIRNQQRIYKIFCFFEKLACRYFYIILAEKSYEHRYKQLSKNNQTILNYCDIDFFMPFRLPPNKPFTYNLFYIGIILPSRGVLEIIEALHQLKTEGLTYHFHCVGELYSSLDKTIRALPYYKEIQNQIHFYGRKPLEEGYGMAAQMDIGMCIIHEMKNSVDSYPTKLFEYMTIGLPIISSNFPLYKTVVEENNAGLTVIPKEPKQIVEAIKSISIEVQNNRHKYYNMYQIVSEKYNWQSENEKLLAFYGQLLGN